MLFLDALKIRYYSKKEARALAARISELLPGVYDKLVEPVVEVEVSGKQFLVICKRNIVLVGDRSGYYVPALTDTEAVERIGRQVVVDQGAVRFVVNGANVMRPGITEYSEFKEGEVVVVREPNYKKPIAIGAALVGSSELAGMEKGAVVRNVHHLRDKAWDALNSSEIKNLIVRLA